MGNMGVELFELEWVSAIILFFSRLAWALFAVSVVVCAFECGIEYSTGRGNLQQCGMNIIKGFLAVSLFTVVPVRLYALSVSLQGTFSAGLTGYGRSIGEVGQDIITELSEIQTLSDVVNSSHCQLDERRHPAHPDRGGQPLYVQRSAWLAGWFYELDAAGHRLVPDCLPPVYHPHCGTYGVQRPRADGRWTHALRRRSSPHRRQLRRGHHNKGQYY